VQKTCSKQIKGEKMKELVSQSLALNDGNNIPVLGLGVFKVENDVARDVVAGAIKAGIRLIDTAQAYNNEAGVGDGILRGGVERERLFITTKVWNSEHGFDKTTASLQQSLKLLKLDYVDLVLIHWPVPSKNLYVETFKALEKFKADGLTRSIGVSNFHISHLERLLDSCGTVPCLNQIEIHPYLCNAQLIEFCHKNNIAVQAWSPLGKGMVLDDEVIRAIAAQCGKTPAQVVLRWHYQKNIITIPKSVRTERIIENADIFSFELSKAQIEALDALDRGLRTGPDPDVFDRE
jgi:diketogulonate reductase-like aldo/keto reductase